MNDEVSNRKPISYRKYLRINANQIIERRKKCKHKKFDEIVLYKRCLCCNEFVAYRSPEDIQRRGIIPEQGDLTSPTHDLRE